MFKWVNSFYLCLLLCLTGCVTTYDDAPRKFDPRKALEADISLGMQYLKLGNRDGAIRAFSRALKTDRRSAEAHQGMALVHQLNGEANEAENSFKTALRSRPISMMAGIEFSYGRFLYGQKRYAEAAKYFDLASKELAYKGRPQAPLFSGRCALMLKNDTRAKAAFEHALNLDKNLAPAALELAQLAFAEEGYARAKKYLDHFSKGARHTPASLWLGIRIERIFENKDKEASYALALKNLYPYSQEYLDYKSFKQN